MISVLNKGNRHPIADQFHIGLGGLRLCWCKGWRAMPAELPEGMKGSQAKKDNDEYADDDQSNRESAL